MTLTAETKHEMNNDHKIVSYCVCDWEPGITTFLKMHNQNAGFCAVKVKIKSSRQ